MTALPSPGGHRPPLQWQQIDEVVAAALDLPAGERDAYVDSACGPDTALSTEVRALIRAYEQAGNFLDPVTYRAKWRAPADKPASLDGTRTGPYRLIRIIGRGGMGMVYLGRRDDEQFEKDVAVKLIDPAAYHPSMMRRFQHERQILASLEHPNIARLLDAGVTPDGIPFIVMEFVAGEPIHEFCKNRDLPAGERLKLFLDVLHAVQFAHRNLVVHRDLKPSNILVTEDGVPKLLDFGIAKILSPASPVVAESTRTAPLTQAMTPDYASPEQLRGLNVNTATDVYSLGILLFELLAGHRPYGLAGKPLHEMVRVICEQEAPRLTGMGDLEYIVAKAIRKDPAERYVSVEEFAADVTRHLAGFPVLARRPSLRYTAGKYVRRHKTGFVLAAMALLLAVAGVAAIVRQANIAERRFNEVRRLARTIIFELHDGIAPLQGSLPVRKVLVTRALEFLNALAAETQNDRDFSMELAQGFVRIGEVQGGNTGSSFGDYRSALASFQKARDLLLDIETADVETETLLGAVYQRLTGAHVNLNDYPPAIENVRLAEEAYGRALSRDPQNANTMRGLAAAYFAHAVTLGRMGGDGLSDYWTKCLDIYRTLTARDTNEPNLPRDYARSLTFYASRLMTAARYTDAFAVIEESLRINKDRVASGKEARDALTDLSMSHRIASETLDKLGRTDDALAASRESLSILQALHKENPQDVYLQNELAIQQFNTGTQLRRTRRSSDALIHFRDAIRIHEDLAGRQPAVGFSRAVLAQSWLRLGQIEAANGRRSAACDAYRRSANEFKRAQSDGALRKADEPISAEALTAARACLPN